MDDRLKKFILVIKRTQTATKQHTTTYEHEHVQMLSSREELVCTGF